MLQNITLYLECNLINNFEMQVPTNIGGGKFAVGGQA